MLEIDTYVFLNNNNGSKEYNDAITAVIRVRYKISKFSVLQSTFQKRAGSTYRGKVRGMEGISC